MVNFDLLYFKTINSPPFHKGIYAKVHQLKYLFYVFIELFQRISVGASTPTIVSPDDKIFMIACTNPNLASDSSLSSG